MLESLGEGGGENPTAKQWEGLGDSDAVTDARNALGEVVGEYMRGRASAEDMDRASAELDRAREDKEYYRNMSEKEAVKIAGQFGPVESKDSRHLEPVRGSRGDREISEEVYPQLEGESDDDYRRRIKDMREESLRYDIDW